MFNCERYTYRVTWLPEDMEFVGLCAEFPSLSHLDEGQVAALEGITSLIKDVVTDMEARGEKIPEPISEMNFSGKFQIRVTPELHRKLATKAAEENVSLNHYISSKLAC